MNLMNLVDCVWGMVRDGVIFCWELRHLKYSFGKAIDVCIAMLDDPFMRTMLPA
jgi:hypothetical protein